MARKQKGNAAKTNQPEKSGFEDRSSSKLNISSWEDVMDSEDEFLANREKILLEEGPARKRMRKMREENALLEASDDEVLELPSSEEDEEGNDEDAAVEVYEEDGAEVMDEDEEITGKKKVAQEEAELEGWGTSRKDLYGDDEIEGEQDALAHETEARRIQQKQLQDMNDDDFGFGDEAWDTAGQKEADNLEQNDEHVLEVLPTAVIPENSSPEERLRLLRNRYPEFEALKREFISLKQTFDNLRKETKVNGLTHEEDSIPVSLLKIQALASYLGVLAIYFGLLTSTADGTGKTLAKAPTELRDHDIMEGIVKARTTWMAAKDLREPTPVHILVKPVEAEPKVAKAAVKSKANKVPQLSTEEVARLASEARRAARLAAVEEDLADLDDLSAMKLKKRKLKKVAARANDDADSDFGDDTELNAYEEAAKASKRKSLRFYTSQITQKANKRSEKGREVGGDTDVPHREKWRERQARLQVEAERRKEMLDTRNGGIQNAKPEADDDGNNSDDYQDLASHAAAAKAAKKKAAKEAYLADEADKQAAMLDFTEEIGPDGKRRINYQIEKNKGLAPHRKKDVRNPRVKKRKKFEQKKKKLGSMKAIYKGGPGPGGYQGELTGIKTGLVKGVKLS